MTLGPPMYGNGQGVLKDPVRAICMGAAARVARFTDPCKKSGPLPCIALSMPVLAHEPNKLSPQRKW